MGLRVVMFGCLNSVNVATYAVGITTWRLGQKNNHLFTSIQKGLSTVKVRAKQSSLNHF